MLSKKEETDKEDKKLFIHFMKAQGDFGSLKNQIGRIIHETFNEACERLNLDKIDIIVTKEQNAKELKEMNGIGAFCSSARKIEVRIDSKHPSVKKFLKKSLKKPLFHEFHHSARLEAGEKIIGGTFLEVLVSEGLADNFVYNMVGEKPKWVIDLNKNKENKLIKKIKKIINKKIDYKDYNKWFLEGSEENIPRWAGYSIAYKIMKNFINNHSNETAASLAGKPIEYFSLNI